MDIHHAPIDHKYPLNYFTAPASLQQLVLTRLALNIWRHKELFVKWCDESMQSFCPPSIPWTKDLPVELPPSIIELIDKRIQLVWKNLQILVSRFRESNIFNNKTRTSSIILSRCFDCITYGPDGRICFERSVKNFLTKSEFTNLEKFKLACLYWFEDDIRRIWPSVCDNDELKDAEDFLSPIWIYWAQKMINGGNEFSTEFFFQIVSVIKEFRSWTALEFILDTRLDLQRYFLASMYTYDDIDLKYILSKLNKSQVNHVLSAYPHLIIAKLAIVEGCFEYVLNIWNLVREVITYTQFLAIIKSLWNYAFGWFPSFGEKNVAQVPSILVEIWTTASNRLKKQFFDESKERYIESFFMQLLTPQCFQLDMTFFFVLFSDMPLDMRTKMWLDFWRIIAQRLPIEYSNRFLNLCLKNEHEIRRFVEEEMLNYDSAYSIIQSLFQQQLYDRLIDYSNLCSWNTQLSRKFRKHIFSSIILPQTEFRQQISPSLDTFFPSDIPWQDIFNSDELIKLCEVVDNKLSNDEANDIKETIFSCKYVEELLMSTFLKEGKTDLAINIIDRFLPTERSSRERRLFLDHWRIMLTTKKNNLDGNRWKGFLFWWVGDDASFSMYKRYFPLRDIFRKLILEAVEKISLKLNSVEMKLPESESSSTSNLEEFTAVDDFLMWYFGSEATVKDYKRRMIWNHRQMDVLINKIFNVNNKRINNEVIRWFFDYDLAEISCFRCKFKYLF